MAADELHYVQMTQPHVEVGYGKLPVGKIIAVSEDRATRWLQGGIAEKSSQQAYQKYRDDQADMKDNRASSFDALNRDDKAALWDVSTHRDALSAPEAGLRKAVEAGVPLVNLGRLRTPDGLPLDPNASIEDILEARKNLHPDVVGVLTTHERASTSGGGSHYDMPMPLNPAAREQERAIRENERSAQSEAFLKENATNEKPGSARAAAAARRSEANRDQQAEPKS